MKIAIRFAVIVASMMKSQDMLIQWHGNVMQSPLSVYQWVDLIGCFRLGLDIALIIEYSLGATSIHYSRLNHYFNTVSSPCCEDDVAPEYQCNLLEDAFGTLFAFGLASSAARGVILNAMPYLTFSSRQLLSDHKTPA